MVASTENGVKRSLNRTKPTSKAKPRLVSVREHIVDQGFNLTLTDESVGNIAALGFRGNNIALALVATDILIDEQPITLRGLMYRVVSAGWLPSTDRSHYMKLSRIMVRLREARLVPFEWIVDGIRSTIKPSSWSGIGDFADTVRDAYRMDFWARMDHFVHVIVEKDAIAGVLSPVTREYDVALSPLRGYSSLSFAHGIASTWNRIEEPIFAYYLGDFDPSGFDLEQDIKDKLKAYTEGAHRWSGGPAKAEDVEWWIKTARSLGQNVVFLGAAGSQQRRLRQVRFASADRQSDRHARPQIHRGTRRRMCRTRRAAIVRTPQASPRRHRVAHSSRRVGTAAEHRTTRARAV